MTRVATVLTTMLAAVAFGLAFDRVSAAGSPGAVYTASNSASGNMVIVFDRLANGALVPAFNVPTGGLGTGSGLGNQGGLTLSRNERWLLVVNAGSDTVSVFEVRQNGLALRDVEPSGGAQPISVAEHHGLVYVLNAGGDNISGFTLGTDGTLSPLIGSARPLSAHIQESTRTPAGPVKST